MAVKLKQFLNISLVIAVIVLVPENITVFNEEQWEKVYCPIVVTLSGIVMVVNAVEPFKIDSPIVVIVLDITTFVNETHALSA